jgi:cyclic beta-1,2-glucan synthetase
MRSSCTAPAAIFETHEGTITPASFAAREFNRVDSPIPEVQLLSNANYHLMLTQAGGSYSRWQNLALTRWREDATCDNWGAFCYLRDPQTGEVWSNTWQPIGVPPRGTAPRSTTPGPSSSVSKGRCR